MSHAHQEDESVNVKVAIILIGVFFTITLIALWS